MRSSRAKWQCPQAPLRLEDALRIANADNAQLQIAGEDYVQALIDKARAAETFLPSISLAPTMTRQEDFKFPNVGGSGSAGSGFQNIFPQNFSDVPINTSLRTSLVRDLYDVSRAGKTAEQRKALLLDLQSVVLLNVAQTYYGVLESEQSVRTLTASVAVQDARVKNVTDRFKQGVARRLDVAQSEADAAATRVQLTDARNNAIKGRATLARLLGKATIDVPLADHFSPPNAIEDVQVLLHIARAAPPGLGRRRRSRQRQRSRCSLRLGTIRSLAVRQPQHLFVSREFPQRQLVERDVLAQPSDL